MPRLHGPRSLGRSRLRVISCVRSSNASRGFSFRDRQVILLEDVHPNYVLLPEARPFPASSDPPWLQLPSEPAGPCPTHSSTHVIATSTSADSASDQCTPIKLPISLTVTPLKARSPKLAMLNKERFVGV